MPPNILITLGAHPTAQVFGESPPLPAVAPLPGWQTVQFDQRRYFLWIFSYRITYIFRAFQADVLLHDDHLIFFTYGQMEYVVSIQKPKKLLERLP